eukprot:m.292734 g.292734  ORF g.292734 m.292734 type:complete len:1142 (+) comp17828_c0_seq1:858-4283(+)
MAALVEIVKAAAVAWQQLVDAGFDPRNHEDEELEPFDELSAEARAELEANPEELEAYKTCLEIKRMDAHVIEMIQTQRPAFYTACNSLLAEKSEGAVYALLRGLLLVAAAVNPSSDEDDLPASIHSNVNAIIEDEVLNLRCRLMAVELAVTLLQFKVQGDGEEYGMVSRAFSHLIERLASSDGPRSRTLALVLLQHGTTTVEETFSKDALLKLIRAMSEEEDPCLVLMSFCCVVTELTMAEDVAECILMPFLQPLLQKAGVILLDYSNQRDKSAVWTSWAWGELGVRTVANMNQVLVDHVEMVSACGSQALALMGSVATKDGLPIKMRATAAETCQSLVFHDGWAAANTKVLKNHLPVLVELIAQDPVDGELNGGNLEAWEAEPPSSTRDEDDATPGTSAEGSLDVLAEAAPKTVMKVLWPLMAKMAQSEDWLRRRAALVLLSIIGEACVDLIIPKHMAAVMSWFAEAAKDPHPRVRHACMHALGQCSSDWTDNEFVSTGGDALVTLILSVVTTDSSLRVRTHALASFINLSEGLCIEVATARSPELFQTLVQCIERAPSVKMQENAITAIAGLVTTLGDAADSFFQSLMPSLLTIITTPLASTDYITLFCRAMECASCLVAAGESPAHLDAARVVVTQLLGGPVVQALLNSDNILDVAEELSYIPMALERSLSAHPSLTRDFAKPLYELIMKLLNIEPMTLTVLPYSAAVEETPGIEVFEQGGNRFVCDVRAAKLQKDVCDLLVVTMEDGEVFLMEEAMYNRLLTLLHAKQQDAATAVLLVFRTYAHHADWDHESAGVLRSMLEAVHEYLTETDPDDPPDMEHLIVYFEAMWRILSSMSDVLPSVEMAQQLLHFDIPNIVCMYYLGVLSAAQAESQWEDVDSGDDESEGEKEEAEGEDEEAPNQTESGMAWQVGIRLSEIAGIFLKSVSHRFELAPVEALIATIVDGSWETETADLRHISVVLLADAAETAVCLPYVTHRFNRILLPSLSHEEPRFRQAAWFTVGQLVTNAAYQGDHWSTSVQPLVKPTLDAAVAGDGDDEDAINATSNVVSACVKYEMKAHQPKEWLAFVEKYFALCRDAEEGCDICKRLLHFVSQPDSQEADKVKAKALVHQIVANLKERGINVEENEEALNSVVSSL